MKKTAWLLALLLAGAGVSLAQTWEADVTGGYRTLKDESLRGIYGNGYVVTPSLSLAVSRSLRVGAEYEGGFSRNAEIGLFKDPSTLKVRGGHVFLQYGERKGRVQPYLKVGMGLFSYQFDVERPTFSSLQVSNNDVSFFLAGGLRLVIIKNVFGTAEFKYAALWVDSYDDKVDLGGLRLLVGVGFGI
ncbi:MAG: outer membrane beta-barrel protein [Candidatus Aminicenantales bacterium]